MEKIATLGRLLAERTAAIGLEMQSFVPMVNFEEDGQHFIQAMFLVDPPAATDAVSGNDDELDVIAGIMAATDQAEKNARVALLEAKDKEKADAARERMLALRDRLDKGKGLLDD